MSKSVNHNTVFFLIAVLVAGIIAISFQSFIDTEASGDKRDHNKHKDSKHENYKSKDPTVIVKKITCNNLNVNINGLRMDISPNDIASDLAAQAQDDNNNNNNEEISANSLGNGESNTLYTNNNDYDDGFIYICIDNINAQDSPAIPAVPIDETTTDETTTDETTNDETTNDETTTDETTTDETTTDETTNDETTNDETTNDETTNDETTNDETTNDETTNDETTTDETTTDETTTDETTTDETPSDETTSENTI